MHKHKLMVGSLAAAVGLVLTSPASGSDFTPGSEIKVVGNFAKDGLDFGEGSKQVSGLACMKAKDGEARTCLAIDDEGRNAQFFTFDGTTMTPAKQPTKVIDDATLKTALGAPPEKHNCTEVGKPFGDLDGEAVAYAAPYFYVVGSHGCSRNKGRYTPSAFITARIKVDGEPSKDGQYPVETTFRLADALALADSKSFAHPLGKDKDDPADGMNVEGVAVVGDMLYAGLRAPSAGDQSLIVGVKIADLFAKGNARYAGTPKKIWLKLGKTTGIRDLAPLSDGRLLVLSGPTRDEGVTYNLHAVNPTDEKLTPLAVLKDKAITAKVKPEGVLPIETAGKLSVVVMFDGLANGGPKTFGETPSN
jgi:hypothetical protein